MRPEILNPLFSRVSALSGVGIKIGPKFDKLLVDEKSKKQATVLDLLFHLPIGIHDFFEVANLIDAPLNTLISIKLEITNHIGRQGRNINGPYSIIGTDHTESVELKFFSKKLDWLAQAMPIGSTFWICGEIEIYDGKKQIVHPEYILKDEDYLKFSRNVPVYKLTDGLSKKNLIKTIDKAFNLLPTLPEWHNNKIIQDNKFPKFHEALKQAHHPNNPSALGDQDPARQRLALDELLANQLALGLVRNNVKQNIGKNRNCSQILSNKIESNLPYNLTKAQKIVRKEIFKDMMSSCKMLRLLQGDVGSGKTIVALLAIADAIESGCQAALIAPTEVLATQHYTKIHEIVQSFGIRLEILTGSTKSSERNKICSNLKDGNIDLIIGTHALLQEDIIFHNLGLAVIDEQHKFGVQQRIIFSKKGQFVDILVMTATPIPRTLAMTMFGDMDISYLDEKPKFRAQITTRVAPLSRINEVISSLKNAINNGSRCYWICPLVDENDDLDAMAVNKRAEELRVYFGDCVGVIHGKLKNNEKDRAIELFKNGDTKVLVGTTVVEVGIDIPEANIIVIEHAERFGLSQLHQLRGRVGRGTTESSCLLLYRGPLSEMAKARLMTIRQNDNGFQIAEEDLRLRGEGELLGLRQSGLPSLRLANLESHARLLAMANDDVALFLKQDPNLSTERGKAMQILLYLFEKNNPLSLLQSG